MTETWSPTEAAARGAAWLDEHDHGWATDTEKERSISLDTLHLGSCHRCVLGQRLAKFTAGRFREMTGYDVALHHGQRLFGEPLSFGRMWELGFYSRDDVGALTVAWRTEIETRRHAQQRAENASGERDNER